MSIDKKPFNLTDYLPKRNSKKIPLQRYWTSRYVITLAIGLVVVAIISALWIRHTTFENRINMMKFMAAETANQIVQGTSSIDEDSLLKNFEVRQFLKEPGRYMQINSDPSIFLVNVNGDVIYSNTTSNSLNRQLNPHILYTNEELETFYSEDFHDKLYMIKKPIETNNSLVGWVVFFELKGNLTEVNQEYRQLFIMIGALAILGWLAIYLLSKRLAKPITDVATAAERIKEGDYQFDIPDNIREKEVYELIQSFKEMAFKLEQLETMRSELLAGVTHELKTPVTSISGLLQALKDGVVEGEEAEEFLDISLNETTKMKTMVEDLLAFNSFVANAVPLKLRTLDLNKLLGEIVYEWEITQSEEITIKLIKLDNTALVEVDSVRLQQIMMNLLNNAKHAMKNDKNIITVSLGKEEQVAFINVTDNGGGIQAKEQPFIFERFYRGEEKKFQTNGFGLGLPFSKMIAQALGGDLELLHSSESGTTFRVTLPMSDAKMTDKIDP